MNISVGNLSFETEESLQLAFTEYGEMETTTVITGHMTGRSKGFGFVEKPNRSGRGCHRGPEWQRLQRALTVNEAQPLENGG